MATCAGAGRPGTLITALDTVADQAARARAGAVLLSVTGTRIGWARASAQSNLDTDVTGQNAEEPEWLAEARAEPAFAREIFDAARRWSTSIAALGEEWDDMRSAVAGDTVGAQPSAAMVLAGLAAGDADAARAVIAHTRALAIRAHDAQRGDHTQA